MKEPKNYFRLLQQMGNLRRSRCSHPDAPMSGSQRAMLLVLTHKRYDHNKLTSRQADHIINAILSRLPDPKETHEAGMNVALAHVLSLHSLQKKLNYWWSDDYPNKFYSATVSCLPKSFFYSMIKRRVFILPFRTNHPQAALDYEEAYIAHINGTYGHRVCRNRRTSKTN